LRVTHEYAFAGIRGAYRTTQRLRAVRTDDGWRIRSDLGERGLPPWEVTAFSARRTRHFMVLAPPGVAVDDLLTTLESGYDRMRTLLTRGNLRRRYLVVVAADAAQARELTVQIRGVQALAAISDAAIREQGPEREVAAVMSLRLVVVWPAFALLTAEGRSRVITHELTHAALAGATSGRTPAWLAEGVALYVSGDRRLAPPDPDLAALSQPDAIALRTGDEQAAAYAASSAAAFAIAERFGRRRLLALYDAFGKPSLKGDPGRRLVDRALRRQLGIGLAELEASLG
jgi:hypothetical protein